MSDASKYDLLKHLRLSADISVQTLADLYALQTFRRKWGVSVYVYDDGVNTGTYKLTKGHSSDNPQDNLNWVKVEAGGGGGHTIIDADDNEMTQRTGLQFLGDVTVQDDEAGNRTKVTVTGGGSLPPKYGEIVEWDKYENGAVKRIKTDYGSSKYIETRVAYHESGDAIGQVDFQEIKDDLTNQWIKITYAYDGAAMTTPSVITVITDWTITVT